MKKMIVFLVFIIFVMGVYYIKAEVIDGEDDFFFRDDFESIDRDMWYVGEWQTLFPAYDKLEADNGIVRLKINDVDRGPFLLSKPFEIKNGDIFSIKRRVKMEYANENFTGGLALFETNNSKLLPGGTNAALTVLGNAVVLVEYVHNFDENASRPGSNVFRLLPRDWNFNGNYQLTEPIFDKWFEEELIYNTIEETITYKLNGREYEVTSQRMQDEYIRVFMHGYGFGLGHEVDIDWVEVHIERNELEE